MPISVSIFVFVVDGVAIGVVIEIVGGSISIGVDGMFAVGSGFNLIRDPIAIGVGICEVRKVVVIGVLSLASLNFVGD